MSRRYEVLPVGRSEAEAAAVGRPLAITITCSPRQGVDRTVDVATQIAALGHTAIPHLAARAIHDRAHLDALLRRLTEAGIDDAFVIAGDNPRPAGAIASAVELLALIAEHPDRPRRLGIAAYPEGHPLIERATLDAALPRKAEIADYLVTQMCFDPEALLRWIVATRRSGIDLPLYVGLPGDVERRRLLEVAMRIGVGTSIAFLRKQKGIGRLLGRPHDAAAHLHATFAPLVGDRELGVAGLHWFTFGRVRATLAFEARLGADREAAADA